MLPVVVVVVNVDGDVDVGAKGMILARAAGRTMTAVSGDKPPKCELYKLT